MFDTIITVTINPALDVTLWIDTMDFNEPNKATKEVVYPGGKAVNISRVLMNLGVDSIATGLCGKENAARFRALLDEGKVHHDFQDTAGFVRENLTLVIPDGRVLKVNRAGASISVEAMRNLKKQVDHYLEGKKNALLVFAGSLPPTVTPDIYKQFILYFKRENVKIALDTSFFSLEDIMDIAPYVIKPNQVEFRQMSQADLRTEHAILRVSRSLTPCVAYVLVSLGGKGLLCSTAQGDYHVYNPMVKVRSTVGAGDTTLAGFLYALHKNMPVEEALTWAVSAGTASVTLDGTEAVTMELIQRYLPLVDVKALRPS